MDELDDLATYNDDTIHNMWVDYTREQYLDEPESFDDVIEEEDY